MLGPLTTPPAWVGRGSAPVRHESVRRWTLGYPVPGTSDQPDEFDRSTDSTTVMPLPPPPPTKTTPTLTPGRAGPPNAQSARYGSVSSYSSSTSQRQPPSLGRRQRLRAVAPLRSPPARDCRNRWYLTHRGASRHPDPLDPSSRGTLADTTIVAEGSAARDEDRARSFRPDEGLRT